MVRLLKPLVAAVGLAMTGVALAGPLADGYLAARSNDSMFLAATPEKASNDMAAAMARMAYLPSAQAQQQQYQSSNLTSRTYSLVQPLVAADKAATVLEGTPRYRLSDIIYAQREADLATRYYKALSDWLKAAEGLQLVMAKQDAFSQQYASAKRALEEGVGTVSDRQDALLRLEQAKSEGLLLKAQMTAAANSVRNITGQDPAERWAHLTGKGRLPAVDGIDDCVNRAIAGNLQLAQSKVDLELAELNVWKARGALAPQVNLVASRTETDGRTTNYTGIQVTMPLGAGSVGQAMSASSTAEKQRMVTQDAENKARLEVQRLHALVNAGMAEVAMRQSAVETASLGVEANEKSFKGGVRSKTDVLNAIQAMFQTKQDLLTARLNLAENYLNLELLQGKSPTETMRTVDQFLFGGAK